jgi:Zn-dependent protease/CBS domain-containing protein
MLTNSIRLFTVRGIEVGVHYSWLIIFGLITWSLGVYLFPNALPGLSTAEYWILGALAALLLFVSVLIHELAHSFMALARGLDARSITLFIFGGVSNLGGEAKQPSTEFLVAIVGPLTSFVLAAVAFGVATVVTEPRVEVVASYVAFINILLGAFNLIPGFPLDGGRVLRSIVWTVTGSLRRATEFAATVGKLVAYVMFGFGILRLADGDLIGGIWTGAIAWFLHSAADSSVQQMVFETRMRRVRVGDIARLDATTVSPDMTVAELVEDYLLPQNRRAMPVATDGRLVGMVTVSDVQRVPVAERAVATVGQVMGGRDGVVTVQASAPVRDAIEALAEKEFEQLPVTDGDRLLGVVTRADVMRQLQLREALDV